MEIRCLTDKEVYADPSLVKRLKFLTNGGWGRHPVGSGMMEGLEDRRPGYYLVAIDPATQAVVGWAMVCKRYYQPNFYFSNSKTQWQIGVYVAASFRCLGVGRRLALKAKEVIALTEKKSVLVCVPWTLQGRRMYEHAGIRITGSWN